MKKIVLAILISTGSVSLAPATAAHKEPGLEFLIKLNNAIREPLYLQENKFRELFLENCSETNLRLLFQIFKTRYIGIITGLIRIRFEGGKLISSINEEELEAITNDNDKKSRYINEIKNLGYIATLLSREIETAREIERTRAVETPSTRLSPAPDETISCLNGYRCKTFASPSKEIESKYLYLRMIYRAISGRSLNADITL